jgi:hypothetical protein
LQDFLIQRRISSMLVNAVGLHCDRMSLRRRLAVRRRSCPLLFPALLDDALTILDVPESPRPRRDREGVEGAFQFMCQWLAFSYKRICQTQSTGFNTDNAEHNRWSWYLLAKCNCIN